MVAVLSECCCKNYADLSFTFSSFSEFYSGTSKRWGVDVVFSGYVPSGNVSDLNIHHSTMSDSDGFSETFINFSISNVFYDSLTNLVHYTYSYQTRYFFWSPYFWVTGSGSQLLYTISSYFSSNTLRINYNA